MISAGEKGGMIAEIMARLATYLENTERLRKKVKTALMYPSAVDRRGHRHHDLFARKSHSSLQRCLFRLRLQNSPRQPSF